MICFLGIFIALLGPTFVHSECGRRPGGTSRVINGQNAQAHSWPWQVSLRDLSGRWHFCGGSLISDRWVVTAAHCIHKNKNPHSYTVVAGAHKSHGSTRVKQTIRLEKIIEHPKYQNSGTGNDIALLKLSRRVKLSDKVGTVCLTSQKPAPGKKCYITGWGATQGGGPQPNILQQAMMPIASDEDCKRKYGNGISSVAHLCAGEARSGATGGCNGDSGGPLVCEENGKWYLHGAVSFGMRNCPTTHYTVFARVASYTDWIKQNTGVGTHSGGNPPTPPPTNEPPPSPPLTNKPPPPPTTNQPKPTTNQTPPPTPSPGCIDTKRNCYRYKHLCGQNAYVKKYCKKTCNLPC